MKRSFGIRLIIGFGAIVILSSALILVVRAEKWKQSALNTVSTVTPVVSAPNTPSKAVSPRPTRSTRSS
ncbi:MAG: hypothetical protein WCJ25_03360 [Candidatus Moraniibacteriota bacterium]